MNRVIVTGAASGIGLATARMFATRGFKVALLDLPGPRLEEAAHSLPGALALDADVCRPPEIQRAFARIAREWGGLEAAVNAAGVWEPNRRYVEGSAESLSRILDVNVRGLAECVREELKMMVEAKQGAIVNLASMAGLVGFAQTAAYCASKHAVVGLTKATALEVASRGVRVNAVCPGVVDTPMFHGVGLSEAERRGVAALHPMRRIARPEEIAEAVFWLCSPAASFVTGISLPVDGGYTAM